MGVLSCLRAQIGGFAQQIDFLHQGMVQILIEIDVIRIGGKR
jgi:hypothetical protein